MQNKGKQRKRGSERKPQPHITVYLSDEEKSLIEAAADKSGQSTTKYIAFRILPQAKKDAARTEGR
jgi:uncharacterized protein (DUF1778 family)